MSIRRADQKPLPPPPKLESHAVLTPGGRSRAQGVATVSGLPKGESVVALVEKAGFTPWLKLLETGRHLTRKIHGAGC